MWEGLLKKISLAIAAILGFSLSACAPPGGGSGDSGPDPESYKRDLLRSDLQLLNSTDSSLLAEYDTNNNRVLTKIFGGASGSSLLNFYNTRVSYVFTQKEIENASLKISSKTGGVNAEAKLRTSGRNLGTALWYKGLVDRLDLTAMVAGHTIPITSTRVGIVEFGDGYSRTDEAGTPYPPEFRNMIMLHEARHSDCTGGVTEADIDLMRNAEGTNFAAAGFNKFRCGHIHQKCPADHQYAGKEACDLHPWGAYAVGTIYIYAILPKYKNTKVGEFLEAQAIDQANRAVGRVDKMISGVYGEPDMSSSGYLGGTIGDR
jgi:hypothetical protein